MPVPQASISLSSLKMGARTRFLISDRPVPSSSGDNDSGNGPGLAEIEKARRWFDKTKAIPASTDAAKERLKLLEIAIKCN